MKTLKTSILFLSLICASGLTMVTVYNTIVDAKSWGFDIPASIQTARDYYRHVDPRNFYALAGPANQILILLTIILFWRDSVALRIYFATSFVLYSAIVLVTFAYFIPRDLILFTSPIAQHLEQIRVASAEWSRMNWLRTLLGLAGVLFSFKGLDTYYRTALRPEQGVQITHPMKSTVERGRMAGALGARRHFDLPTL